MPEGFTLLLLAVLGLAVAFDYINGFHDTANAIATSVSTRALSPQRAIALSATANFVGALTGTAVAKTIASGIPPRPTAHVISSAIMGVGSSDRLSAVRWGVAGNIIVAWVLTIPASAGVAWLSWEVLSRIL